MLLYHGSNLPVNKPRLIEQTRGLDFGAGFYMTARQIQAYDFAEAVTYRRKQGIPTVSVYEFDEKIADKSLDIKIFSEANAQWLEFVKENRLKIYAGKQYDIIIGPVSDDRVFLTLQGLIIGQFTAEVALSILKPYKLYDQYCMATDAALSTLIYKKSVTSREEIN